MNKYKKIIVASINILLLMFVTNSNAGETHQDSSSAWALAGQKDTPDFAAITVVIPSGCNVSGGVTTNNSSYGYIKGPGVNVEVVGDWKAMYDDGFSNKPGGVYKLYAEAECDQLLDPGDLFLTSSDCIVILNWY